MLSGWTFFKIHKAIDFHFNVASYDVIKYSGKINVSPEKYGVRSDRYRFEYYGGKFFNREKASQFCIANFIRGNRDFIYNSYEDAESEYLQWRKIQDSITKVFQDDLNKIESRAKGVDIFSVTPSGNQPPLLQMIKASFITVESAVLLYNEGTNKFFDTWAEVCNNDPYAKTLVMRCMKYRPFVKYQKDKIQTIIKEHKFQNGQVS